MATQQVTLKIEGMTCGGCARSVTNVLSKIAGVADVTVDAGTKLAQFQLADGGASLGEIKEAVEDAGYAVVG